MIQSLDERLSHVRTSDAFMKREWRLVLADTNGALIPDRRHVDEASREPT